ncbi:MULTISPECIES: RT0821/Lpp0805 family surface protein [unclassified Thioalkalivibrio]|uniref:RT0821/Lpp0805 family surface protein n=1 Tax=unclassified Thioalkalivibrio TaxID=2621013 RepID=UPI0003726A95|nr:MULTISPECIES: RT0821/Lpp0805 family surface protein [unclassified Thioalkalivibrio]
MRAIHIVIAGVVFFAVGAQPASANNEMIGQILGGFAGGAIGSQVGNGRGNTAATIAGTLLGASVGGSVGRSMDQNDQANVQRALETQPDNRPVAWRNPNTGGEFRAQPTRTYQSSGGKPCRTYRVYGQVGGEAEAITGRACRQSDGTWRAQ